MLGGMTQFIPFSRDQAFLLPRDAKDWLPEEDVAHVVVAAVERVPLGAFAVRPIPGGKAQDHPRLTLALLIYSYANGIFSSRRIERATYRDIGVRYVVAKLHPDHDTIAAFRRANRAAFEAAFPRVLLLLARESGLLRLGTVAIEGTKLDANASRIRSIRYDRAKQLRARLAADIAERTVRAEAADAAAEPDPQALPAEIARRCALKAKLDAACARLEEQARAEAAGYTACGRLDLATRTNNTQAADTKPTGCQMTTILTGLVGLALLATLGVLVAGLAGFARGVSPERSNMWMRYRIVAQAVALVLFLLLLALLR
jgi:transposase